MIDIICFNPEIYQNKKKERVLDLGFSQVFYIGNFRTSEGSSMEKNRKSLMERNLDIMINPEKLALSQKEGINLKQIGSGLNEVLCKLAHKNEIAIGFSLSQLLNAPDNLKPFLLARLMQNVRLCRKNKTKMVVASFARHVWEMRHAKDLLAFARLLGMQGGEANKALNFKQKEKKIQMLP